MQSEAFIDYYESLQISHSAEPETVHRVYRILAQRYHPDNPETGNVDAFHAVSEAYEALNDPQRRAAYDVRHREHRRLSWRIFDQSNSAQGIEGERRKRQGILALLYRKRIVQPDFSGMTPKEFEDLLGVPKEHLEFSLWYLKEGQWVQRADTGRYCITLKGVDIAESMGADQRNDPLMLSSVRVA